MLPGAVKHTAVGKGAAGCGTGMWPHGPESHPSPLLPSLPILPMSRNTLPRTWWYIVPIALAIAGGVLIVRA